MSTGIEKVEDFAGIVEIVLKNTNLIKMSKEINTVIFQNKIEHLFPSNSCIQDYMELIEDFKKATNQHVSIEHLDNYQIFNSLIKPINQKLIIIGNLKIK